MSDKIALVTGASRGIGKKIAEKLSENNYELYLVCQHNIDAMYGIPGHYYKGNVADYDFVASIFEDLGHLDLLVNNAGISRTGLLQDMSRQEWDEVISVNLTSLYNTCHFAAGLMVKQHSGRIINMSSMWGARGASMEVAYSASKGGINAFTKALAKELAPSNIQVNAIACGVIDTDMNSFLSSEERACLEEDIPAGRFGTTDEVSDLVLSLAEAPSYLTGQIIGLDGAYI